MTSGNGHFYTLTGNHIHTFYQNTKCTYPLTIYPAGEVAQIPRMVCWYIQHGTVSNTAHYMMCVHSYSGTSHSSENKMR